MSANKNEGGVLVTKDEFRRCMSEFATGVTVVTTLDEEGEIHGMSANSFTSVCLEPPIVLVCVAHNTNTYRLVENRKSFGINILSGDQEGVGKYFARRPEDRTGDVGYDYSLSSACEVPALKGALAFFGCQVVDSYVYGDHTIYIAEVKEIYKGEPGGVPLLFFESRWYGNMDMAG
jgi:flavin reductase (DIM6/NTAB) family NADH-FMN oxidoreductase RutF